MDQTPTTLKTTRAPAILKNYTSICFSHFIVFTPVTYGLAFLLTLVAHVQSIEDKKVCLYALEYIFNLSVYGTGGPPLTKIFEPAQNRQCRGIH